MDWPTWDELKKEGSAHYKTGGVELMDVYKAAGILRPWVVCEIAHHAFRNRAYVPLTTLGREKFIEDMKKIIHYAKLLVADLDEKEE